MLTALGELLQVKGLITSIDNQDGTAGKDDTLNEELGGANNKNKSEEHSVNSLASPIHDIATAIIDAVIGEVHLSSINLRIVEAFHRLHKNNQIQQLPR